MSSAVVSIIVFAIIAQVVVERLKPLFTGPLEKFYKPAYAALVVSVFITVAFHVDMFSVLGLEIHADPIVAYVLTGIIISGGANVVNDLFKSIQNLKVNTAPEEHE